MDLTNASAVSLKQSMEEGSISAVELASAYLDRAEKLGRLNVFVHLDREAVLSQAKAVDEARSKKTPLGPLAGLPVAIKDVLCVRDEPTTCGSRMLKNFKPPYDATVVDRLRSAGAILFGKTNMDEFAMGSSTENSFYGPTLNPWDETRIPGGSSGGAAASVAADLAPLSLGSDTGGSIRQPAALCGVVGLKPTYGRVSRYGLIAFASSLDQIGPFAHDVSDAALLLNVIAGRDPLDSTSVDIPTPDYLSALDQPFDQPLKIGVVKEFSGDGVDPEVQAAVDAALAIYKKEGAVVSEVALPHSSYGVPAYYIVAPAECSSNLARYEGTIYGHRAADFSPTTPAEEDLPPLIRMMNASRAEGFGAEVKRRIMLGTFALSAGYADQYYNQALKVRRLIRNDFDEAFKKVDVLISPTSPTPAFKLGERVSDPLAMYLSDIFTITANLAGIPGISIPCGTTKANLPIGLQLLAPAFAEEKLLKAARLYERSSGWNARRPGIAT